jgi:hypothetical protein
MIDAGPRRIAPEQHRHSKTQELAQPQPAER